MATISPSPDAILRRLQACFIVRNMRLTGTDASARYLRRYTRPVLYPMINGFSSVWPCWKGRCCLPYRQTQGFPFDWGCAKRGVFDDEHSIESGRQAHEKVEEIFLSILGCIVQSDDALAAASDRSHKSKPSPRRFPVEVDETRAPERTSRKP